MAKFSKPESEAQKPPTASEVAAPPKPRMSLTEFCISLSHDRKQVEMIAGFHQDEAANGRAHDTQTAFQRRFDAFRNRPIRC